MRKLGLFFLSGFLLAQEPIWEEIARMENQLQRGINALGIEATVFNNDPVRGYYVAGQGVFVVVPVRYRLQTTSALDAEFPRKQNAEKRQIGENQPADQGQLSEKVRMWKQVISKRDALKEASYDQVLTHVEKALPELLTELNNLPNQETLVVVIEEHEPAYVYATFEPVKENQRRVSILKLGSDQIRALKQDSVGQNAPIITTHTARFAQGIVPNEKEKQETPDARAH